MKTLSVGLFLFVILGIAILGGIGFGLYKVYLIKFRTKKAEPNQALLITGRNVFTKEELKERIDMINTVNEQEKTRVEKENEVSQKKFDLEQKDISEQLEILLTKQKEKDYTMAVDDLKMIEQLKQKKKAIFEPAIFTPLNPNNYTAAKIVRGGTYQLKLQQYSTPINLNSFQLTVNAKEILVRGNDLIDAEGVVQLSVGTTDIQLLRYSEQFLGKKDNDIQSEIKEIISTHFRAILTTLTVEEINSNRESFNNRVKEIAQKDLDSLGFKLVNFGLISVTDSPSKGNDLGFLASSEKIRKAIMTEKTAKVAAETKRSMEIDNARNENESLRVRNELDIKNANSKKEKEEQLARLAREIAQTKAEASKAEEREMLIQEKKIQEERNKVEEEKRKGLLQIALIQADEKKQIESKNLEIALEKEKREKERFEIQNAIELEKAQNIRRIEEEKIAMELAKKEAEIKANALEEERIGIAKAEVLKAEGFARAEASKAEGFAKAESIKAEGFARAEVEKAEGTAKVEVEKALAEIKLSTEGIYLKEKAIETAPKIAESIGLAMSGIDSVKLIGGGESNGVDQFTKNVGVHTAMTYEIMKELTGVDMAEIAYNNSKQGHFITNELESTTPKSETKKTSTVAKQNEVVKNQKTNNPTVK